MAPQIPEPVGHQWRFWESWGPPARRGVGALSHSVAYNIILIRLLASKRICTHEIRNNQAAFYSPNRQTVHDSWETLLLLFMKQTHSIHSFSKIIEIMPTSIKNPTHPSTTQKVRKWLQWIIISICLEKKELENNNNITVRCKYRRSKHKCWVNLTSCQYLPISVKKNKM